MPKSTYMDRAMRAADPRYARILSKLGYGRRDMRARQVEAPEEPPPEEMAALRAEYERIVGRRPFMGWDADTLRAKMAAARGPED